ncbi:MAG TPA: endopeptidase La, partial [Nitrospirales bacterium]|nr:endopeptidase La [Nitrospirales bacterium]
LSYVRSRGKHFGLEESIFSEIDIHVHVPAGAIPKDGPSAGITLASALTSALTNTPVRHDIAMTGEVTLRGRVLPVGGLKEKLLAARREKLSRVIIPKRNQKDFEDIPKHLLRGMHFIFAATMDDVIQASLYKMKFRPHTQPRGASKTV